MILGYAPSGMKSGWESPEGNPPLRNPVKWPNGCHITGPDILVEITIPLPLKHIPHCGSSNFGQLPHTRESTEAQVKTPDSSCSRPLPISARMDSPSYRVAVQIFDLVYVLSAS